MLTVAVPLESVAVPMELPPSKKLTVPVGDAVPLADFTVAVKFTAEPSVIEEDEEAREVAVLIRFDEPGVTVRLNVTLCTRSPLTAHNVTGTVCAKAVEEAASVSVENPLVRLGTLNDALTPEGRPDMLRSTLPKLKESTRTVAVARPDDIVYALLSMLTLKSAYAGAGTPHADSGDVEGGPQVEL